LRLTELKQTVITWGIKINRNYSLSQTSSVMYTICCLHLKMPSTNSQYYKLYTNHHPDEG